MREIRRKTRRRFAPEEKIRIVLDGLRGEQSISDMAAKDYEGFVFEPTHSVDDADGS